MIAKWLLVIVLTSRPCLATIVHAGQRSVRRSTAHLRRSHAADLPPGVARGPSIGGAGFRDSPAAINVWSSRPNPVIQDLEPIAPLDRVDRTHVPSLTSSVPLSPTGSLEVQSAGHAHPDWVPDYLHPHPFPHERGPQEEWDGIIIPIEDRNVVANGDQLRQNRLPDYPVVAPGDALAHGHVHPVAIGDQISYPDARFIDQVVSRSKLQGGLLSSQASFLCADTDADGKISPQEFEAITVGEQGKTNEESQVLWGKYHFSEEDTMSQADFVRLMASGFDLGQEFINRTDLSSVKTMQGVDKGYWGAGAACPDGKYATGMRLKMMPLDPTADNSALNSVSLRCDDGAEIQSVEGPDGAWSDWVECPAGEYIYGARIKSEALQTSGDNLALSNVVIFCRTKSFNGSSEFEVYSENATSFPGGWGSDMKCSEGGKGLLCAVQARVWYEPEGACGKDANATSPDNMGLTNLRLICCTDTADCAAVCGGSNGTSSAACAACQQHA
mmetsp:Transcript_43523/g.100178  ORF Transcript_43523/g.100178 Transcript_43523/m.100178 type:complete len:500 (-) Transcript_43523:39-1538(-)